MLEAGIVTGCIAHVTSFHKADLRYKGTQTAQAGGADGSRCSQRADACGGKRSADLSVSGVRLTLKPQVASGVAVAPEPQLVHDA